MRGTTVSDQVINPPSTGSTLDKLNALMDADDSAPELDETPETEEESEPLVETEEEPVVDETEKLVEDDENQIISPPTRKKILAKYPELFKEFKFLETAMFRSKAYSEVFPTVDDAKEALSKSEQFDDLQSTLDSGDTSVVLKNLKESNPEQFTKVVDNYLENLRKVDNQAFLHVQGNILKQGINGLAIWAQKEQNQEAWDAAILLNQLVFQTKELTNPSSYGQTSPEKDEVSSEREKLAQETLNTRQGFVNESIDKRTRSLIDMNIDPKGQMSPFVKKNAIKEATELIHNSLKGDKFFQSNVDKMWKTAQKGKYDQKLLSNIESATLTKAKVLLPQILKKVRAEALTGMKPNGKQVEKNPGLVTRGGPATRTGNATNNDNAVSRPGKLDKPITGKADRINFLFGDK